MASPRWRFYGLGRGLGSNEKVEMTLCTKLGEGHMGLIYFSPLALFDMRRPRAHRGPAFEPRSVVAHVKLGNYRFVTQHGAL